MHCTLLVLHGALGCFVQGKGECARLQFNALSCRQRFRVCAHVRVRVCRACVQNLLDQIRNFRLRKRGSASAEGEVSKAREGDDKGLRKEASLSSMSGLQFGAPLCLWGLVNLG